LLLGLWRWRGLVGGEDIVIHDGDEIIVHQFKNGTFVPAGEKFEAGIYQA